MKNQIVLHPCCSIEPEQFLQPFVDGLKKHLHDVTGDHYKFCAGHFFLCAEDNSDRFSDIDDNQTVGDCFSHYVDDYEECSSCLNNMFRSRFVDLDVFRKAFLMILEKHFQDLYNIFATKWIMRNNYIDDKDDIDDGWFRDLDELMIEQNVSDMFLEQKFMNMSTLDIFIQCDEEKEKIKQERDAIKWREEHKKLLRIEKLVQLSGTLHDEILLFSKTHGVRFDKQNWHPLRDFLSKRDKTQVSAFLQLYPALTLLLSHGVESTLRKIYLKR